MPISIQRDRTHPADRPAPVGIILAAGLGERLKPLTDVLAKPALPFLNQPLVEYGLNVLARAGIQRIGVNVFHRAQRIVETVEGWRARCGEPSMEVELVAEAVLMGTGGGARGVWEAMGRPGGPVVVMNGDIVADFDLGKHLAGHQRSGALATLVVTQQGEGRVFVDERSERIVQLPGAAGPVRVQGGGLEVSFAGASILEPGAMRELPVHPGCLIRNGLSNRLLAQGQLRASFSDGVHIDVGTPDRYWSATKAALDALGRRVEVDLPPGCTVRPPVLIDATTLVEGAAELGPYAVTGGGARVAEGARVSSCVAYATHLAGVVTQRIRIHDVELPLV